MLSAVIITFNEAHNIGRCLESLRGVADDIVVVDSFSTDDTEAIVRKAGARFVQRSFDGFGQQKNFALDQALFHRVLSLDADEALSDTLREAIIQEKANWRFPVYSMNRLTNYCGKWIHHSGWYPDTKIRLVDRRLAHWTLALVHESLVPAQPDTPTGHLAGDLLHYSYYSVEEHLARARKYASLAAQSLVAKGKAVPLWRLWVSPAAKFIRNFLLHRGFLDGRAGFTISRIAAMETYWKYRDARRLSRN